MRGANPQSGVEIDEWDCAIAWGPVLAINTAQQVRQGAAATESFRNEMVNLTQSHNAKGADLMRALVAVGNAGADDRPPPKLIEGRAQ